MFFQPIPARPLLQITADAHEYWDMALQNVTWFYPMEEDMQVNRDPSSSAAASNVGSGAMNIGRIRARPARSAWLSDLAPSARRALLLVVLSVCLGILLRLLGFTGGSYSWFLLWPGGSDSWFPVSAAYAYAIENPSESIYNVFFSQHIKFQYPPSSLLIYVVAELFGVSPTQSNLNVLVWLSILAMPVVIYGIAIVYMEAHQKALGLGKADRLVIASAFAVSSLFFYPIMWAWPMGQVQALLNLFFTIACLCWLTNRKFLAGALIGAICLVKPQFVLFLLWGALRRQVGFLVGLLLVLGTGTSAAILLFGFFSHIDYLKVLSFISTHGEIFYANQSINGLLNRALALGYESSWQGLPEGTPFAPYHPFVYAATLVSGVLINFYGIVQARRSSESCSVFAFAIAALCFTIASPVAWIHHYGIMMPIFVLLFLEIARRGDDQRGRPLFLWMGICFVVAANLVLANERWSGIAAFVDERVNVLESYLLFAALGTLALLHRLR